MNYEKKYQEALERAKEALLASTAHGMFVIQEIFPELIERKEEMIRKDIISYLRNEKIVKRYVSDIEVDKWIAWLEKQGKKLDPDKVIAWLVANICDYDYYVKLFKKDFEI